MANSPLEHGFSPRNDQNPPLEGPNSPHLRRLQDMVFPVSTRSRDASQTVFEHEIVGGLSKRDYIAIELLKGLLSNPAYVASVKSAGVLREVAIREAHLFLEDLAKND